MPWKGVVRFGKTGKLAPRYVGPFEILERIGLVAYRLRLPEELNSVHDTFHVSNLNKCLADANLHVPLDEIKVDKTLCFVEEPVEIMDREIRKWKRRKVVLVKVRWNSKRGLKFTWEHEDQMRIKYPQMLMIPLEVVGLLAGIHGLFSGRNCFKVRWITYGYPWPELEGKRFAIDSLSLSHQRMRVHRIAKVDLLFYEVGLSKSHKVLGIAPVAIIDRLLPFEYTITSRSTDVIVMALLVQNINHSAFRKCVVEQPIPPAPAADSVANVLAEWNAVYDAYNEVACLMLESNGVRAQVEAIGRFDLVLPNGIVICLENCHYAPSITRVVVSVHRLVENGFVQCFTNFGISVSKNNVLYFNVILSNGKMTRKSFPHHTERATDLLGIIHIDVCGPLRHVLRQGARYFITFTDDYSHYGYVYLLKHKHEVFETFKVFKNKVKNQLGKTIKALRSDQGGEYISRVMCGHRRTSTREVLQLPRQCT
ncbi:putative reverse transcriptase domain-containing protein [Tanacetum coccineum]